MRKLIVLFVLLYVNVMTLQASEFDDGAELVNIGVLAFRGSQLTEERWKPMAAYLSGQVSDYVFKIVPVSNDNIESLVENGKVDFILTNPASYATLEKNYGVRRLATLLNRSNGGSSTEFGAVIFTRTDRLDINGLIDLKGKSFMAVHRNAFGGWWMAKRELLEMGLDPNRDFQQVTFSSFPQDKIVYAVRNGEVDAGTVRTSVLERMSRSGDIDLRDFRILNPQQYHNFHQRLSTRLYPEWPFAATRKVSIKLAQDVTLALLRMPGDDYAARTALITGWTSPLDYQSVHELMQELQVGTYSTYGKVKLEDILGQYWHWFIYFLLTLMLLITTSSYVVGRNHRLQLFNKQLEREILVREDLEGRLKYQAMHDALTELPNRTLLMDRLRQAIYVSDRSQERLAVAVIDLDQFKYINDTLGHDFGDKVLKQVSERFLEAVRKTDTIARMGGDEFVLLIQGFKEVSDAVAIAQKLLDALQSKMSMSGHDCKIGASIGIALYPDHGDSSEILLRHADLAMYKAKSNDNSILLYDASLNSD